MIRTHLVTFAALLGLMFVVSCADEGAGVPGLDTTMLADGGIGDPDVLSIPDSVDSATAEDTTLPDGGDGQDAAVASGAFGDPCTGNSTCLSGWCVASDEGNVCTKLCVDDCPDGWGCVGVTNTGADATFICLPTDSHLCEPCVVDQQCGAGFCVELTDGRACSRPCDQDGTCPPGFSCVDAPDGAPEDTPSQCVPVNGSCSCLEKNAGAVRPCSQANDAGTCWGIQTCDGTEGWGACTATTPAPEDCNGMDDDCDGLADEELLPPPEACQNENDAGTCMGAWTCSGAAGFVCNAATRTTTATGRSTRTSATRRAHTPRT